jgi:hypothetical protein
MKSHRTGARGGPLPRPAFRSFLATAVDPSPKLRGRGDAESVGRFERERTAPETGPLPRPAFRSFLATAVDPSPKLRGRGDAESVGRFERERTAPGRAPSPPAPLPRYAGERGEFDRVSTCVELRPPGCPSPGPSPLVPHGEGRIRSRFGSVGSRHLSPMGFMGERTGEGGAFGRSSTDFGAHRFIGYHPSPEVGGGVAGRREERAKGPARERAPAGTPRKLLSRVSLPTGGRR